MTRNDIALIRQRALFNGTVTSAEVVALCNALLNDQEDDE